MLYFQNFKTILSVKHVNHMGRVCVAAGVFMFAGCSTVTDTAQEASVPIQVSQVETIRIVDAAVPVPEPEPKVSEPSQLAYTPQSYKTETHSAGTDSTDVAHAAAADDHSAPHSAQEARPYDKARDAQADVAMALADAAKYNKRAMIVMGANWCHDSRALATHFETERFQTLLNPNYVVTYVDVGQKDRNEDIARRFGLKEGIVGTPTVIITDSNGTVLNLDTAPTWRNAASRTEDATFTYFEGFAK